MNSCSSNAICRHPAFHYRTVVLQDRDGAQRHLNPRESDKSIALPNRPSLSADIVDHKSRCQSNPRIGFGGCAAARGRPALGKEYRGQRYPPCFLSANSLLAGRRKRSSAGDFKRLLRCRICLCGRLPSSTSFGVEFKTESKPSFPQRLYCKKSSGNIPRGFGQIAAFDVSADSRSAESASIARRSAKLAWPAYLDILFAKEIARNSVLI